VTQVLHNILSNAIKYSPAGGQVWVAAEHLGGRVRLTVRDEGIGIAADALPLLFRRFYRSQDARDGAVAGLGLGLTIAKGIIDAHGGSIAIDSIEGQGTTVTLELPYAGPGAQR
jgi:signal transduction histidine kinase